ncbi:MAG TPA: hypothetical protein VK468_09890, partial [Pyrinomonadaceae bacterium]|nr:hypothetical protein [Pyrinomonadaceae bacterium]
MKNLLRVSFGVAGLVFIFLTGGYAQQVKRAAFDVTGYRIEADLSPADNRLTAVADVTFVPQEATRVVTFELNGSLKLENISRVSGGVPADTAKPRAARIAPAATGNITFVQDQVGVSDLGPSVRVEMPDDLPKGVPVTLRFKYAGVLNTANGGPLLNKRLAYVGDDQGYLMYASRWFPFHDYAADLATSDITINIPSGLQVLGFSDAAVSGAAGKFHFTQSRPGLVGNFAYGRFTNKTMRFGDYELQFYTRPGNDTQVESFGETIGKALEFYTKKYGASDMGKRLIIAQIDDESLDFYTSLGMLFISSREFEQPREITQERLQRETALQWWGQTVGLKSFDDAWLSQGLAEYSAYALRESTVNGAQLEGL